MLRFISQTSLTHAGTIFSTTEKESEILEVKRSMQHEMQSLERINQKLRGDLETEKTLLSQARSGLQAAQQLNLQLEEKSRLITEMKNQGKHLPNSCSFLPVTHFQTLKQQASSVFTLIHNLSHQYFP